MPTKQEYVPTANTKGLYRLNGNANDDSGNSNNGTATNVTWIDGKIGSGAGSFNGSSSYISSAYSNVSSEITTLFWFKTSASTNNQTVWSQTSNAAQKLWLIVGRSNHPTFPSKLTAIVWWAAITYSASSVVDWQWTQGAIVLKSWAYAIYLNGQLSSSSTASDAVPTSGMPQFYIGKTWDNDSYFWGSLDELIIENRAWTASEIRKYYTYSKGRFWIT